MRSLDASMKSDLIKNDRAETSRQHQREGSLSSAQTPDGASDKSINHRRGRSQSKDHDTLDMDGSASPRKNGRSQSRTNLFRKPDISPQKGLRSGSRSRSLISLKNASSTSLSTLVGVESRDVVNSPSSPQDFVEYLRLDQTVQAVEVGKLHKLRLLLRNETIEWVSGFIMFGGMPRLLSLLRKIMEMEWR